MFGRQRCAVDVIIAGVVAKIVAILVSTNTNHVLGVVCDGSIAAIFRSMIPLQHVKYRKVWVHCRMNGIPHLETIMYVSV